MNMTQPEAVVKDQLSATRSLGAILVEAGRLSQQQAGRVVLLQKQQGLKFGEAARRLGIINDHDILFALSRQFEHAFLEPGDKTVSPDVMAAFGSPHPLLEGLRDVRARVMLHWLGKASRRKSLVLVSARPGEGKSFIAANLAVLFSQLGQRTLLIDADLIRPCQHRLFKLDNRAGLSSVLCGLAGLEAAATIPRLNGLAVLPGGPPPPNPRELLSRPQFASLLAQTAPAFDVVLIDTPSLATAADAQTIAAHTDAALLVSRPNVATIAEIAVLSAALDNLLGAVVNQF